MHKLDEVQPCPFQATACHYGWGFLFLTIKKYKKVIIP